MQGETGLKRDSGVKVSPSSKVAEWSPSFTMMNKFIGSDSKVGVSLSVLRAKYSIFENFISAKSHDREVSDGV